MLAVGNEQWKKLPDLKGLVDCKKCGHKHLVRRSKEQWRNGQVMGGTCSFIKCQGETRLVGMKGKDIRRLLRAKAN